MTKAEKINQIFDIADLIRIDPTSRAERVKRNTQRRSAKTIGEMYDYVTRIEDPKTREERARFVCQFF